MRISITKDLRRNVYNKYDGHCSYCGCEISYREMQVDHFHPLYNGGTENFSNYMPSCKMCNFYKSTYDLEKFRTQLTKIIDRLNERTYIYRLAKKYNLIKETNNKIEFYFEKCTKKEVKNG